MAANAAIDQGGVERLVEGQKLIGVSVSQVQELVKKYGEMAGIEGQHPHMLRRTFG